MTEKETHWEKHEADVQKILGLSSTIASGNKFYDPGDGVHHDHYTERKYPLIVDAKCTRQSGYRIDRRFMKRWVQRADEAGKTFGLPIRFQEDERDTDYIVVPLDHYAQLLEDAEEDKVEVRPVRTEEQEDALKELFILMKRIKDPAVKLKIIAMIEVFEAAMPKEV